MKKKIQNLRFGALISSHMHDAASDFKRFLVSRGIEPLINSLLDKGSSMPQECLGKVKELNSKIIAVAG